MVKCEICGQEYKKITASHVKTHEITYDEYIRKYEPDYYFIKRGAELLDDLYITVRYKWDTMNSKGEYKCYRKSKKRYWGLSISDIKYHLEGKKTIAVYSPKNKANRIGLDIDISDNDLEAREALEDVFETLGSYGIARKNILLSYSGRKGYHVDLFLADMLDNNTAEKFYKLILIDTDYTNHQIELSGGNNSYKLPLGINFKARHAADEGYCYLCNEYGRQFNNNQALYKLERIKLVEPNKIKDILEINDITILTEQDKSEFKEIVDSINLLDSYSNSLEALVNSREGKGITEAGTRHKKAFVLALGYKEQGYCSQEIYQKLIDWHKTLNSEFYKTSFENCKKEYRGISKDVFRERYKLPIDEIYKEAFITRGIMEKVLSVKVKGKGTKALKKLLFVMIIHSLMYANKAGIFYMTYDQMNEATKTQNNRNKLKNRIDKLAEQGHIEIIRRDRREEDSKKHKPNKYRVKNLPNKELEQGFKVCNRPDRCKECMYKAICFIYTDKEIKDKFSYRKGKKITSVEPCSVQ